MTELDRLREAVEKIHGGTAAFTLPVPVSQQFEGRPPREGELYAFDIVCHPPQTLYAWSSPIEGIAKRRLFAVAHQPPVDNPQTAARAAIVAEAKGRDGERR